MTRRRFLGLTASGVGGLVLGPIWSKAADSGLPENSFGSLYRQFQDPDRRYSIRPFWFWNGKLEASELRRQIKLMVDQGVYGAYAHNRDGLQTPYLSDEWWSVLGEALQAASENGFSLCMVDEFEWPSGEARDYWMPGTNKSRVVAVNPDFQARRMNPVESRISGPRTADIPLPDNTVAVVAGRLVASGMLDGSSLKSLPFDSHARHMQWDAPAGEWIVFTYGLERTIIQPDYGTVDLMNRDAVATFIRIYYEEFYRRHGSYFGAAMPATFADHEGCYGGKLPWTPALFEAFQQKAGYDLLPFLPGLTYDIGDKTEKVRCDLLDTVSELYCKNFFEQISDWCRAHKIDHSAHVWEETLIFGPSYQGDFFRILRSMTNPGCDSLEEWGRQSIWLKENASVAEFENRHVVCENQAIQGGKSYQSPEKMKRVSNCLGAWNIGEFIPHAFNYDLARTNYPPDWFFGQPFQPWFRSYADQMRRISFMNRDSHLVADILLYYPQISVWGQSAPSFVDTDRKTMMNRASWSSDANETDYQYAELKFRLSEARLDYLVADDHYLGQGRIDGKSICISNSRFHSLILPPMSAIRREGAEKVRDFYRAGGTVIAMRRLPTISAEDGRNDKELAQIWEEVFDARSTRAPFRLKTNAAGGRGYFVPRSVPDLLQALQSYADPDVRIVEGSPESLYVLHKIKADNHFYWVVNDTSQSRTTTLSLKATGRPERWDADNGQRSPLFYQSKSDRTLVRLTLAAWDAAYVVFDASGAPQPMALKSTNMDDLYVLSSPIAGEAAVVGKSLLRGEAFSVVLSDGQREYEGRYEPRKLQPVTIEGDWKVTPLAAEIPLPYAQVAEDPQDLGMEAGWCVGDHDECMWEPLWLSPMSKTLRDWNLIGPFPYPQARGLDEVYPPEESVAYSQDYYDHAYYDRTYSGGQNMLLRWQEIHASDYGAYPYDPVFQTGTMAIDGGPNGARNFYVRYNSIFASNEATGSVFAQTNVYSPKDTQVVLILACPNPHRVYINGQQVYSRWAWPLYDAMSDGFSNSIPVQLKAGWNSLMVKIIHNVRASWNAASFVCRIQEADGSMLDKLFCSTRTYDDVEQGTAPGFQWLRFAVAPLAGSLKVPKMKYPWVAYVDGVKVPSSSEIPLRPGAKLVALRVAAAEPLIQPFAFSTISRSLPLGSWKVPGQEHYSGQMSYEKAVTVSAELLGERLLLDCGAIGVVAEGWVNGKKVGAYAWEPYVFDVTEFVHAGINQIKVVVANTESNHRATGISHDLLEEIDLDGWHGPVRLVPYACRKIQLKARS